MFKNHKKKTFIEFELSRELLHELPNAVDKLQENRRDLLRSCAAISGDLKTMTTSCFESMTKRAPLLFNEILKTTQSSIITVE